ncbi:MAG: hypothetical protein WAO58_00765 [Fimbriimonadaceae bacterium]
MRYSSINHWYKIEEVLGGLEGTSSTEVQVQLLKHLSSGHIKKFKREGAVLQACPAKGDPMGWNFRSPEAAEHFLKVVCEWFKSQGVLVPSSKSKG